MGNRMQLARREASGQAESLDCGSLFDRQGARTDTHPMVPVRLLMWLRRLRGDRRRLLPLLAGSHGVLRQAGIMWALDLFSHVIDYGYHLYLGRTLPAGAFGQFQSFFSLAMLALIVAFGFQPVVARYIAAPPDTPDGTATQGAMLRTFGAHGLLAGTACMLAIWAVRVPLGNLTGLPRPLIVLLGCLLPVGALRGVTIGALQGQSRLGILGLTNLLGAVVRMLLVLVGIGVLGFGLHWAAGTVVLAIVAALIAGLLALRDVGGRPGTLAQEHARAGWSMALSGLLMSVAYMALTNLDVVWVNRMADGTISDAYSRVVVLRRIVAVFSTAISVALLPRVAAAIRAGRRPDRAIAVALSLVVALGALLVSAYALGGDVLYSLAFGSAPGPAGSWIPSMAIAMLGYSVVMVWVNVLIVADPRPYARLMALAVVVQVVLYVTAATTPESVIAALSATSWVLAIAGGLLYWLRVRPGLASHARSRASVDETASLD